MKDYELRILTERCDLYIKIIKLKAYLIPISSGVELLYEQLEIMEKYLTVLDRRIEGMI